MSTISLSYPEDIRVQHVPAIRLISILSSLVLIAIIALVMLISAANAEPTDRAAVSQNSIAPVPVPVPTAPITEIQPVLSESPTPYPGETSEPSVEAVPVPAP